MAKDTEPQTVPLHETDQTGWLGHPARLVEQGRLGEVDRDAGGVSEGYGDKRQTRGYL